MYVNPILGDSIEGLYWTGGATTVGWTDKQTDTTE